MYKKIHVIVFSLEDLIKAINDAPPESTIIFYDEFLHPNLYLYLREKHYLETRKQLKDLLDECRKNTLNMLSKLNISIPLKKYGDVDNE